jgi:hypothetical protein
MSKVNVRFLKNYSASVGAPIAGAKGAEKQYPMTDDLQSAIDGGCVELVRGVQAETATAKRAETTSSKKKK